MESLNILVEVVFLYLFLFSRWLIFLKDNLKKAFKPLENLLKYWKSD